MLKHCHQVQDRQRPVRADNGRRMERALINYPRFFRREMSFLRHRGPRTLRLKYSNYLNYIIHFT